VESAHRCKDGRVIPVEVNARRIETELADSTGDVFFAMDMDLRFTYWNKASENLTGISAEEAIGKSLYEVYPDVKGTTAEELYLEGLRTHQPFLLERQW